ncbi:MAG: hypothetical protein Q7J16_06980 [Candidatus Cloacimonadales bacterium]|nr:hypothetical protein [Candidatus Cloacimonadales bacterium]
MDKLNPLNYINSIHKQKYLASLWPIILILITFIINHFYRVDEVKYIALFGLLWYMFVFVIFKINKAVLPEDISGCVLSPVNGRVTKIEGNKLIITKYFWQSVDIRNATVEQNIDILFHGKQPILWEDFSSEVGKLIGFKTGKLICEILLPDEFSISVSALQKVISGHTILASKEV